MVARFRVRIGWVGSLWLCASILYLDVSSCRSTAEQGERVQLSCAGIRADNGLTLLWRIFGLAGIDWLLPCSFWCHNSHPKGDCTARMF